MLRRTDMWEGIATVRLVLLLALAAPGAVAAAAPPEAPRPKDVALVYITIGENAPRAGESVVVSVVLLDERGEPVDAADVALDCDQGELGALTRLRTGVHRATLTIPRVLPHDRTMLLGARAGAAAAEEKLVVAPGPAAEIALAAPRAVNVGIDPSVQLEVTVLDAFGNGASDPPRVQVTMGSVGPPRVSAAGRWAVEYVPPRVEDEARDDLTIEAGDVRATHQLRLATAHRWLAVSPWSGAVRTQDGATALAVGASAGWWWRARREELGVVLDVAWWRQGETTAAPLADGAAFEDERTYVPVTAAFGWGHRLGRRAAGWLTIGAGAASVSARETLAGQPALSEAGWAPAATATAALGGRAWRGMPFVEARALWIGDPGLVTVTGPVRAGLLLVGYRYDGR